MENIIQQGIFALASTNNKQKDNWFLGHIGASIIAGGLFLHRKFVENQDTYQAILTRAEDEINKNKSFIIQFDNNNLLSYKQSMQIIVNAIQKQKNQLMVDGHNVIFAALVIDAINEFKISLSEEVINNIVNVLENCQNDNPKRYYSIDDHTKIPAPKTDIIDWNGFYKMVIDKSVTNVFHDIDGYFLAGCKLHGITFAHAISIFKKLEHHQLANSLAKQLLKKIELSELHPKENVTKLVPYKFDVNELRVWRDVEGNNNAHQIKLVHSFYELTQTSNVPTSKLDGLWGVFKAVRNNEK